ncbi:hypothetical protein [Vagococcus hydrophili]|uniref:NTP pyrophosphohydrolase MazG putative catalytic core domain-containing protein n=1 Tax=Vagococcus hydrophili TaxID=2714947 RepID=A0A6G8AQH0_9ENTE|nr:hypothetical protein [Vagococcus hydrophili]QIL47314.1 hypothetical protein G7082_01605 [Vagococcus hydrophili]
MNEEEYLLVCLMEEASEIAQAAAKSIRFGLDDTHPDRPKETNEQDLLTEFYQLLTVMELLQENGQIKKLSTADIQKIKVKKKAKLIEYMNYSKDKGKLRE